MRLAARRSSWSGRRTISARAKRWDQRVRLSFARERVSLAEPRLLGRGEGGNLTCSRGMFDCVTYNLTDITLRNARPHTNNTEPLDLPSELLRD